MAKETSNRFFTIFKSENENIVIGQTPNASLIMAIIFYLVRYFSFNGTEIISRWGFIITITYWSYLEIRFGVNTWRRILGFIVLVLTWLPFMNISY